MMFDKIFPKIHQEGYKFLAISVIVTLIIWSISDFFGIIFTASCLLVLINGANFIDGLNGLCSGYFFLVSCAKIYLLNIHLIQIFLLNLRCVTF